MDRFVSSAMTATAAVILAAGKGSRMKSQRPKVLHRLCGKEMIGLVLDTLRETGLDRLLAVVPSSSRGIRDALGNDIRYVEQREPLGTGHALLQAQPLAQDADLVVALYGDVPLVRPETLLAMIRTHSETAACITLLTSVPEDTDGLGRIVRSRSGEITAIVEAAEADEATSAETEVNGGVYCFEAPWLWKNLEKLTTSSTGEVYLTDLVAVAAQQGMRIESLQADDPAEALGVNTRVHLAEAEKIVRGRVRVRWMLRGVTLPDPSSVYIDATVELGQDTVVHPNTHVTGASRIGNGCEIGPNSIIHDSTVGDRCKVVASVIEDSVLGDQVDVGPFSHIRPGSRLDKGVHIGNFAEVKNSRLGPGATSGHFSYVGDAELGANVNVGAGTVTCNYDGEKKNKTRIGDDAFIGSGSMLVAPVDIGARSSTGAGSVVTSDIPDDSLAVGVPAKVVRRKSRRRADSSPPGARDT